MADHITIRKAPGKWVVRAGGAVLGETANALELTEGARPPVICFPREDVAMAFLERTGAGQADGGASTASHYAIVTKSGTIRDAAWSYEDTAEDVSRIRGHLAFHPSKATVERL